MVRVRIGRLLEMRSRPVFAFLGVLGAFCMIGCAGGTAKCVLKVDSVPSDALISVHETRNDPSTTRKLAGATPVERLFEFPQEGRLWLELEKRGYASQWIEVVPETRTLSVQMTRMKDAFGSDAREYVFPCVRRLLLVVPNFEVIRRGFARESVSEAQSKAARDALLNGMRSLFGAKYEVLVMEPGPDDEPLLRPLWRDTRTAMEMVDPVRLKYLPEAPCLETKSSREAAARLRDRYRADAVLFVSGRQNVETAGMMAGKMGLSAAGTMCSYTNSYCNAVARGDSYFVYTIYLPGFAEGTSLKAILVECSTGEIAWANQGIWGPVDFDDPEAVSRLAADLFSGLR